MEMLSFKVARYLPSFSMNYVAIYKDLEKLLWCENGHFCYNECRAPALSWAFACPLLLLHKDYF